MSNRAGNARVFTQSSRTPTYRAPPGTRRGAVLIVIDTASGATTVRSKLTPAMDYLNGGDTLVVWRIDRLGRSVKDLIEIINDPCGHGVGLT